MQYPTVHDVKVGDRVYHTKMRANGIVTQIDNDKIRDTHKVEFFWAKYCKNIPHGETWNKWAWVESKNLVTTDWYIRSQFLNKVSSIGGRSLDRLIRKVCEIPRRKLRDGSDVVIVYGQSNHSLPSGPLVLNRNLQPDKFLQCKIMGDDLAPETVSNRPEGEDWIIKPTYSIGGRGIRPFHDMEHYAGPGEYYQKRFDKVREFRVHVFLWMDQPVQMIQEKLIEDKSQLTWNKKQGGKFRFGSQVGLPDFANLEWSMPISKSTEQMVGKIGIEACKALKYDFGGVDVGMDKFGNLKVFEVNSRMGLLEQALFTYKRAFTALRTLDINKYRQERWS